MQKPAAGRTPASKSVIRDEVRVAYNAAAGKGNNPPNIRQLAEIVHAERRRKGYEASKR
jgi:hypothetical protein